MGKMWSVYGRYDYNKINLYARVLYLYLSEHDIL